MENCYLVWDDEEQKGILVDPGDEPERIMQIVAESGIAIEGIFNTHGHLDHAGGVAAIARALGIPFALHVDDWDLVAGLPHQAQMFGLAPMEAPQVDRELTHGETFRIGEHAFKVLHTPGHTPGGVCFHSGEIVIVGDTLFQGSIGRTDLPGGSYPQLIQSIQEQLLPLSDWTQVLSGHGPVTTVGFERAHNPFLQA